MALGAGSTEATWAAVEYVTQPLYTSEIVSRVGLSGGKLPEQYQIIVHVRFRRQVPVQMNYVTHRVLDQSSTSDSHHQLSLGKVRDSFGTVPHAGLPHRHA